MPLDTASLKAGMLELMTDMRTRDEVSDSEYAERFANLMMAFVMTGEVVAGIPVSTSGTAAAQTGATTGTGTII